jgi:hypothetical protein
VLFTTAAQGDIVKVARGQHWETLPCQHMNEYGTPFIKDMYYDVIRKYNATFYGFSNGDILYNSGLIETLDVVNVHLPILNTTFLAGRRWNYNVTNASNDSSDPIWLPETVEALAREEFSELSGIWSADYFFVSKNYPWDSLLNVVIGRLAYDNYLIGRSIQLSVPTIDGTETIAALHQTGPQGVGDGKRSNDSKYNHKIFGDFNYPEGKVGNSWLVAKRSLLNEVVLVKQMWNYNITKPYHKKKLFMKKNMAPRHVDSRFVVKHSNLFVKPKVSKTQTKPKRLVRINGTRLVNKAGSL